MSEGYDFDQGVDFDEFTLVHLKDEQIFFRLDRILPNKTNAEGWTLLMYACCNGQKQLAEYLLSRGARTSSNGLKTPLMLAIGSGDLEIVRLVFNVKDLEARDARGWTALFYAVFYGRQIGAEFLLNQGANPNLVDNFGQSPVHIALKYGMDNMVTLLMGANKTEPTPTKTPARQTPKAKTSIFRTIRSYSPNARPSCSKEIIGKENEAKTPAKKIHLTPKRLETTPVKVPGILTPKNDQNNVLDFLVDLRLEKYWPIFRKEEIDFDTLLTFDEENLKDIGINLYGPRKKIIKAIQEYRTLHGGDARLLKNSFWLK